MKNGTLPGFFAVGPPRTATTWLDRVLLGHVNLPERVKETRFFDLRFSNGLDWYKEHFEHARPEVPTGEIAPTYFYSVSARNRIAAVIPNARLIVTLRDPVNRLFSHYQLGRAAGRVTGDFANAITEDTEMAESSRYVFHLTEWLKAFGRDRVLVLIFEDLIADHAPFLNQVAEHIGLPANELNGASIGQVNSARGVPIPSFPAWTKLGVAMSVRLRAYGFARTSALVRRLRLRKLFLPERGPAVPPIDPELAARIREDFTPEVEALEQLLNRDLSIWKSGSADEHQSQEPDRPFHQLA
jgi:hypothetical protein